MANKVYYKKRLVAEESGLVVWTQKFISVHETPCFHFCIPENDFKIMPALKKKEESPLQYAKRRRCLKRISKTGSRIAFENEKEAMEHLRFLKRKQIEHMKRDIIFLNAFLDAHELEKIGNEERVPHSVDLVCEYYFF